MTLLVERLERTKLARAARPRTPTSMDAGSRTIPAAVRRAVSARDGGRCAFVGADGRCGETGFLEFHHVEPFARGGAATIDNIQLRCRAHNQYEAVEAFGRMFVRECEAEYFAPSPSTDECGPVSRAPLDRPQLLAPRCAAAKGCGVARPAM